MNSSPGTPTARDLALDYLARGWSPIPNLYRDKKPWHNGHLMPEWQKVKITVETLPTYFNGYDQNVGILLGEPSNGLVDVDLDAREALATGAHYLPRTESTFGRKSKPRSHHEYLCSPIPKSTKFLDPTKKDGDQGHCVLEVRSTGGQTVFPRSTHESGELVEWDSDGEPAAIGGGELVWYASRAAAAALVSRHWPGEGARHSASLALAGGLLRAGWDVEQTREFIHLVATTANDEEASERAVNVDSTYRKITDGEQVTGWPRLATLIDTRVVDAVRDWLGIASTPTVVPAEGFHLTDLGNARRLAAHSGENLRYCHPWSKWLNWDGQRWPRDITGQAVRHAKDTVRMIYREAADEADPATRKALASHATKSENAARIAAMLTLAASEPGIAISPDQLDRDPMLLNVANGTIDLRTGQLRPHNRADLISKLAPVAYDLTAEAPTWVRFLERVLPDPDVRSFVQRAAGYSLTGDVGEQCLFFLYGSGANGKSTLITALRAVLGDYADQAAPNLLLLKKSDSHPTEIASLQGVRFLSTIEVEQGKRLAEALTKQLTGGDAISARRMHEDFWTFTPTHKFWIGANHRPKITGTDLAIWRRIHIIPFTEVIPELERDRALPSKLRAEAPGILRWALEGCRAWQREGLGTPQVVRAATEEYRKAEDVLAAFIDDCCTVEPTATAGKGTFYRAYQAWCEANGEKDGKYQAQRDVSVRMVERGFVGARANGIHIWRGIRLTSDSATSAVPDVKTTFFLHDENVSCNGENRVNEGHLRHLDDDGEVPW